MTAEQIKQEICEVGHRLTITDSLLQTTVIFPLS